MAAALMLCDPTRAFEDALILAGTLAPPFSGEGCRTSPQQKSRTSQGQIKPASKTLVAAAANRAEARIRRPSAPRGSAGIAPEAIRGGALPGRMHDGTDHWISVRTSGLHHIPRNLPLRRRLRFRRGGAQDHRQRAGCARGASADHQYPADVAVRGSAQRNGAQAVQALVDAI